MTGPPPAYSNAPTAAHSNTLNVPLTAQQIEQREREQADADSTDTDSDSDTERIPLEQRRSIVAEHTDLPNGWVREWDPSSVLRLRSPCVSDKAVTDRNTLISSIRGLRRPERFGSIPTPIRFTFNPSPTRPQPPRSVPPTPPRTNSNPNPNPTPPPPALPPRTSNAIPTEARRNPLAERSRINSLERRTRKGRRRGKNVERPRRDSIRSIFERGPL